MRCEIGLLLISARLPVIRFRGVSGAERRANDGNHRSLHTILSRAQGATNPRAIHSSKAVGEPPLFLAASAFFAIKDAIASARHDAGHDEHFVLDSPATPERIRMACVDDFTAQFAAADLRPKLSV